MKRKTNLHFFDISSNIEELPENELFEFKGGYSDGTIDGGDLEEVEITPPDRDEPEDDWGTDDPWDDQEDPWDEPEDDWEDHGGGGDNNEEEEQDECTCSQGIVGQGSGLLMDSTGVEKNLSAAITADLNNPDTNQSFKNTLNGIQTILNRIGNSNFNLVIEFGDAKGSDGLTSLQDNENLIVTLDRSKLVYENDTFVPGTNIVMNKQGELNNALVNNVLVHELKHVEQFLDGRIGFESFDNEKLLNYGVEDEVEAFSFAESYSSFGGSTEHITSDWVKNQEIKVTKDGVETTYKPYETLGNGGNCPVHGVSSNPN